MPTINKINLNGVSYDIGGLTEDVKQASLQIAEKVAYIDEHGQDYYDELYTAFYDNMWNVTNTLSNAVTSNPAVKTPKDGTYTAIISAATGYTLDGATVSVTMNGANITSSVYSNGTITIPAVTGDVVITVVAVAVTVVSISAVYTQSGTVYDTLLIDALKADLVVIALFNDNSTSVVPSDEYTLSGTLEVGTSTVTVDYEDVSTTFNVTVSSRIPSEYKQVEYVESSGAQVIVTDIIPRNTMTEVEWEFTGTYGSPDYFICGVYNANNQRYYAAYISQNDKIRFVNRSNNILYQGNQQPTGRHTITYNNALHQALVDGEVKAADATLALTGGDNKLALFARGGNIANYFYGRIYSAKFTNNDTSAVIGNFIPCYRKSDGVIGMYDLIAEQFYTNSGTGEFTKGADAWETAA